MHCSPAEDSLTVEIMSHTRSQLRVKFKIPHLLRDPHFFLVPSIITKIIEMVRLSKIDLALHLGLVLCLVHCLFAYTHQPTFKCLKTIKRILHCDR